MINIHLNGDIVRCPNISEIQKRAQEIKDAHRICIYNYHEDSCSTWQSSFINWQNVKKNNCAGRCPLAGGDNCPGHIRQSLHARKEKTFSINNQVYRKLASGSHYMVKESEKKTIFITLTYPPFIKKYDEKEINESFSRFAENLHKNYSVKYYIAVKEYCPTSGRPHFHMLLSIPFTDFSILNTAWCAAISNISGFALNALTTEKGKSVIIRSPQSAMRYACKYFSKCRGTKSKTRLVFMSLPLILGPKKEDISINDILKGYKSIYIHQTSDYTTCFRITDIKEFTRFCYKYLYALFELSDQKTDFTGIKGSLN